MNFYLKAKHWQLFLIFMAVFTSPVFLAGNRPPTPGFLFVVMLIFFLLFFGWICSVGISANERAQPESKKSPKFMLTGLLYAIIYMGLFMTVLLPKPGSGELPNVGLIFPFHIFAMICILYGFGYASKRLVTLQLGKEPGFFEYSGPFFLFGFFPLGVWFIQPKVNELLGTDT